jgi:hypothetical protein
MAALLLALPFVFGGDVVNAIPAAGSPSDTPSAVTDTTERDDARERSAVTPPRPSERGERIDRRHKPGIGSALGNSVKRYGRAVKSLAVGTARLGANVAVGRPVRGGKEFGKGVGGFGKHVGVGTGYAGVAAGRAGKQVGKGASAAAEATGRAVKRAVTP